MIIRHVKKEENVTNKEEKKSLNRNNPTITQIFKLLDEGLRTAITNMFKKLNKNES